jgi:molybdopterin-guanine dinucleotide biosynthesis adapter protein
MRVIGIIGYHNSGKTYAGTRIAGELKNRGYTVAAVKHIHGNLDYADKDTAQFTRFCHRVVGLRTHTIPPGNRKTPDGIQTNEVSTDEVYTIEKKKTSLQNILLSMDTDFSSDSRIDFAIVEGFKDAATFPKIICDTPGGKVLDHPLGIGHMQVCEVDENKISQLCDLIEEKAFFLAGADCKKCGFSTCFDYARALIAGKVRQADCLSLPGDIHVSINGETFALHPFVGNTLKGTILGFIKNLKGYKEGSVVIKIS